MARQRRAGMAKLKSRARLLLPRRGGYGLRWSQRLPLPHEIADITRRGDKVELATHAGAITR